MAAIFIVIFNSGVASFIIYGIISISTIFFFLNFFFFQYYGFIIFLEWFFAILHVVHGLFEVEQKY